MSIDKQICPCCGQSVNKREIMIFASLINALYKVWKHCEARNRFTFTRKEAKIIFAGNENITARFGDLIHFGGILFHPDGQRGIYGFNIERAHEFFGGRLMIPTRALKDPIANTYEFSDYRYINQIKDLRDFLTEHAEYIVRYNGEVKTQGLF